jgi:hypothetical protein
LTLIATLHLDFFVNLIFPFETEQIFFESLFTLTETVAPLGTEIFAFLDIVSAVALAPLVAVFSNDFDGGTTNATGAGCGGVVTSGAGGVVTKGAGGVVTKGAGGVVTTGAGGVGDSTAAGGGVTGATTMLRVKIKDPLAEFL